MTRANRSVFCPTREGFYTGRWEPTPNKPRPYLHYTTDHLDGIKEREFRATPQGDDPDALLPWNYYEW